MKKLKNYSFAFYLWFKHLSCLNDIKSPEPSLHVHVTRLSQDNLHLKEQQFRTETSASFFSHRIVKIWNNLPLCIRSVTCNNKQIFPFKKLIQSHYLDTLSPVNKFNPDYTCTWVCHCRCTNCRQYNRLITTHTCTFRPASPTISIYTFFSPLFHSISYILLLNHFYILSFIFLSPFLYFVIVLTTSANM